MKEGQSTRERAAEEPETTNQLSPEMEQTAAQRARQRSRTARWDLDVAVFFFAVLIIVIILLFQGMGIEVVAPSAIAGLAMGWLMGWRKGKQAYDFFYKEELARLEQELEKAMAVLEATIEERVQRALRDRLE